MKAKIPNINIDGGSIIESMRGIIDYAKYRKYAKEGFTTVIEISEDNTTIHIRTGIITDGLLSVKGLSTKYLIDKMYMLPTKKVVTRCAFVKEDAPTTLDMSAPVTLNAGVSHNGKQAKILLNKFAQIKLLDEFNSFNMGQVILGLLAGIIVGALGFLCLQMLGGVMVG